MSFANVATLYQKIGKGAEGGHEFARFIRTLLIADYEHKGKAFISESDASGDYKNVDGYSPGGDPVEALNTSYQFKFFPSKLSTKHRAEIKQAIQNALSENKFIGEFIIVTPEDFMKEDQNWFDNMRKIYEKRYQIDIEGWGIQLYQFSLTHWGHSKIVELALKHEHVGRQHFPELFPFDRGKFRLVHASIDCKNSNWFPFENNQYGYSQGHHNSRENLTSDPVFDFHFTNNSSEILLLKRIEIHIESVTSKLKGIPAEYFLESIGTIEHRLNFHEPVNSIDLDNPMIFSTGKAMRFNVQLNQFTKDCPGNCARIKFWFYFNNYSLPIESFYLSF